MAGFRLQPLYGVAMQQAQQRGDLDEMKALAEQAVAALALALQVVCGASRWH